MCPRQPSSQHQMWELNPTLKFIVKHCVCGLHPEMCGAGGGGAAMPVENHSSSSKDTQTAELRGGREPRQNSKSRSPRVPAQPFCLPARTRLRKCIL